MKNKEGFSLIGLITLVVVAAIAVPPLMLGVSQWLSSGCESVRMEEAVQLARDLMEEILSKDFEDPDASEESSREDFDDVGDYDDWSATPPENFEGTALTGYDVFTRSATVVNVPAADLDTSSPSPDGSTDYKRITVRVDWEGHFITLEALKVRFDQTPDDSDTDGS